MFSKLAYLGLAVLYVSGTSAQRDLPTCSTSSIIIDSEESLDAIRFCSAITGTITIEYGPNLPDRIEFSSLRTLRGSLLCVNTDEDIRVTSISAPMLEIIDGDLYLSHLVDLERINFSMLESATRIRLNDLPKLESADFLSTLKEIDVNYEIWNTSLTSIENDHLTDITFVEIFDNPKLEEVKLTALRNASYDVALKRNKPGLEVDLPELEETWYLDLDGIAKLNIPKLKSAIGYFRVNSSSIEEIEAPDLETVGTWEDADIDGEIRYNYGLVIENNPKLDKVSFPELKSVQMNLTIRNNPALKEIDGFPELEKVTQNVRIEGEFDDVELPDLNNVGGSFHVGSDNNNVDCGPFDKLKSDGKIKGPYFCPGGKQSDPEETTGAPDATPSDTPNAAVGGFGMFSSGLMIGVAGVVALLHAL